MSLAPPNGQGTLPRRPQPSAPVLGATSTSGRMDGGQMWGHLDARPLAPAGDVQRPVSAFDREAGIDLQTAAARWKLAPEGNVQKMMVPESTASAPTLSGAEQATKPYSAPDPFSFVSGRLEDLGLKK